MDYMKPKEGKAMQRLYDGPRKGRKSPSNLREQVNPASWPTPDTTNANDGVPWEKSKKQLLERRKKVKELVKQGKIKQGSGRSLNLATAVQKHKAWPTPTTAEADKISNRANYGQKGLSNHPAIRGKTEREKWENKTTPPDQTNHNTNGKSQESLKLNPNWVEQMMGLDVGWTQLPTEWID